jgi:hypothetical protein
VVVPERPTDRSCRCTEGDGRGHARLVRVYRVGICVPFAEFPVGSRTGRASWEADLVYRSMRICRKGRRRIGSYGSLGISCGRHDPSQYRRFPSDSLNGVGGSLGAANRPAPNYPVVQNPELLVGRCTVDSWLRVARMTKPPTPWGCSLRHTIVPGIGGEKRWQRLPIAWFRVVFEVPCDGIVLSCCHEPAALSRFCGA